MVFLAGGLAACDRHAPQRVAAVDDGSPSSLDQAIARVDEAGLRLTDGRRQDAAEMQASMQDAAITARVNAALMSDAQLSGLHIQVQTRQGTVTLRGSAPDALVVARATELASAVEGVTSVVNEIKVSST
jgi:osmotically-inducible protein OsmY